MQNTLENCNLFELLVEWMDVALNKKLSSTNADRRLQLLNTYIEKKIKAWKLNQVKLEEITPTNIYLAKTNISVRKLDMPRTSECIEQTWVLLIGMNSRHTLDPEKITKRSLTSELPHGNYAEIYELGVLADSLDIRRLHRALKSRGADLLGHVSAPVSIIRRDYVDLLTPEAAHNLNVIPTYYHNGVVTVVSDKVIPDVIIEELMIIWSYRVMPGIVPKHQFKTHMERYYEKPEAEAAPISGFWIMPFSWILAMARDTEHPDSQKHNGSLELSQVTDCDFDPELEADWRMNEEFEEDMTRTFVRDGLAMDDQYAIEPDQRYLDEQLSQNGDELL